MLGLNRTLAIAVLSGALWSAQQPQAGAIAGRVTDSSGGVLPGVTVTVTGPGVSRKVVTSRNGDYTVDNLSAGVYRIETYLPGFRRAVTESVQVEVGRSTTHDVTLRLGALSIVDYVHVPIREAVSRAAVVAHLRITRSMDPRFADANRERVVTDHQATVLGVVKSDQPEIAEQNSVQFTQRGAGFLIDAGERVVGPETPYSVGSSYILFFQRQADGRLVSFAGPQLTFLVSASGGVTIPELPGGRPDMPVGEAVAALKKLVSQSPTGAITKQDGEMQLGLVLQSQDELPRDGVTGAVRDASVVAHLEITESHGPGLRNALHVATAYRARVLSVVKADQPGITPGSTLTFDQRFAGTVRVDGRSFVGLEQPYVPGQGFIAFLRRNQNAALEDLAGDAFMFPASKGFVLVHQPGSPDSGLRPTMKTDEALAALRKLLGAKRP